LELAPPFQRKPVWSDKNKSYLIDTILNNLPVPELYIQVRTDIKGNTKYRVVDGQQRIRTILEFVEDKLALLEEESEKYGGAKFTELPEKVRTDFWDYALVTRELKTEGDNVIKDIFRRLNKYVVPLNRQELRNATYGGYLISIVNKIAEEDDFWAENRIVAPTQIKRMLDAEFISELFMAMILGIQQKDQDALDDFYKGHDSPFRNKDECYKNFKSTENKIEEIFGDDLHKSRWRQQPDFYSLFIAVYELSKEYYFPEDRYEDIKQALLDFVKEVDYYINNREKTSKQKMVQDYVENIIRHTTHKSTRQARYEIIRRLIIPQLVARDRNRNFTEEERRIAWDSSKDKICAICDKSVKWEDYHLDHKVPWNKGGRTELRNSQITHKKCNISKSNKA